MKLENIHLKAIIRSKELSALIKDSLENPRIFKKTLEALTTKEYAELYSNAYDIWVMESPEIKNVDAYCHDSTRGFEQFPMGVKGVKGAYFVFAQEFDDSGPYRTVREAMNYLIFNYSTFLEDPNEIKEIPKISISKVKPDSKSWKSGCRLVLKGHSEVISGFQELSDNRIVSWGWDNTIKIWDLKKQAPDFEFQHWPEDDATQHVDKFYELPDQRGISWTEMNMDTAPVVCWDLKNGKELFRLDEGTYHFQIVSNKMGKTGAFYKDRNNEICYYIPVWDLSNGKILAKLETRAFELYELSDNLGITWSPNKKYPQIWDLTNGKCMHTLKGHDEFLNGFVLISKKKGVSFSKDQTLRVWDLDTGTCLAVLNGHRGSVAGFQLLSDGHGLSWGDDNAYRIWDLENGICSTHIELSHARLDKFQEIARGRGVTFGNSLYILDLVNGSCLFVLEQPNHRISGFRELLDGRGISWSWENTLCIWDLSNGVCLHTLIGHSDSVEGFLELQDGRGISWSSDKTMRVWDLTTGECLSKLVGHKGGIRDFRLLSDGRGISMSSDQTMRIWDLSPNHGLKPDTALRNHGNI